jgi:hypothetical protein
MLQYEGAEVPMIRTLLLAVGALLLGGDLVGAETAAAEQLYFEAAVLKGKKVIAQPHALVKVGALAKLAFEVREEGGGERRLALHYRVDRASGSAFTVTITALADGQEVASRSLALSREEGAAATFEGGGLAWEIAVEHLTPERLKQRQKNRPRDT